MAFMPSSDREVCHTHSLFQAYNGPLAPFWKCNSYGCSNNLGSPCLTELLNQSFQIIERAPVYTFSSRPATKPNTFMPAFTNKTPSSVKIFIQRALGSAGTGSLLVFSYVFVEVLQVSKISLGLCMPFMAPVLIWSSDYAVFSEQALVFSGKYIIFSYSCKIGLHFIVRCPCYSVIINVSTK